MLGGNGGKTCRFLLKLRQNSLRLLPGIKGHLLYLYDLCLRIADFQVLILYELRYQLIRQEIPAVQVVDLILGHIHVFLVPVCQTVVIFLGKGFDAVLLLSCELDPLLPGHQVDGGELHQKLPHLCL